MYDYNSIISKTILQIKKSRIQSIDEDWKEGMQHAVDSCYFNFGGSSFDNSSRLIQSSKDLSHGMVIRIIVDLFELNGIPASLTKPREKEIARIIAPYKGKSVVFVFHEFLKSDSFSPEFQKNAIQECNVDYCIGVPFIRNYAYMAILNHNNNLEDFTRGTNQLSLNHFFAVFFGQDEYQLFESAMKKYEEKVQSILGIKMLSTLEPEALSIFKRILSHRIIESVTNYKINTNSETVRSEITKLKNVFIQNQMYTALLCGKDYSQSLMTSYWLQDCMKESGNIDYVPVAMGYFKCIEQLMLKIILFHKSNDNKKAKTIRRQYIKDDKKYLYRSKDGKVKYKKYVPINDENIEENRIDTTLGSMINSFFKQYREVFIDELSEETVEYITSCFEKVSPLRNGYFHKENLSKNEWYVVETAQNIAFQVTFLLLASCKLTNTEKEQLGIYTDSPDDYHKLCQYINDRSDKRWYLLKFNNTSDEDIVCMNGFCDWDCREDGRIDYKELTFRVGKNNYISLNRDNMPDEIYTSIINIYDISKLFEDEKTLIFKDGVFCVSEESSKLKYDI